MIRPYTAQDDRRITYNGNKIFPSIDNVVGSDFPASEVEERVRQFKENTMWGHIARINHRINVSANDFFDSIGALFTTLPLTTRMISSPGAVYGKEAISYTSDTSPVTLRWFDLPKRAFLAESSQIYLELALMQHGVDQVYSVYNSFRKEFADETHLSEFHHIEYEGKVGQDENERIALGLVGRIINDLLNHNEENLAFFLDESKLNELGDLGGNIADVSRITYAEAMSLLYDDTKDEIYKKFTMDGTFGSWEEVRLTQIIGGMVAVREYPLLEVPFYHAIKKGSDPPVAENTDIIWPGYRETIGSGHRVRSKEELERKAEIFDLPKEDYKPYLQTRELADYFPSSGFGLGWERLLQGLLEMPFIWSAVQFPRGHNTLKP